MRSRAISARKIDTPDGESARAAAMRIANACVASAPAASPRGSAPSTIRSAAPSSPVVRPRSSGGSARSRARAIHELARSRPASARPAPLRRLRCPFASAASGGRPRRSCRRDAALRRGSARARARGVPATKTCRRIHADRLRKRTPERVRQGQDRCWSHRHGLNYPAALVSHVRHVERASGGSRRALDAPRDLRSSWSHRRSQSLV